MVDDRNHLPSTPRSVQEAYTSMQPLIRHNASTPYRQNGYGPGGTYVDGYSSGHSTAYGSPVSNHWLADEYSGELHGHSYRPVPIHDWNGPDHGFAYPDPDYTGGAPMHIPHGRGTPATLDPRFPRTSYHADREEETKARPPKGRRRKDDIVKNKISLPGPMSEVTANSKVSVEDTLAFVNRSAEDRKKEVEGKKDKKIPRPMNSFLLYRKAYQERIKEWTDQKNHQKVSEVAAASWQDYESIELKNRYAEYAKMERDNHHLAWPNWKFRPKKGPNKRKGNESDLPDEDLSDPYGTDPDWRQSPSAKQAKRTAYGPYVRRTVTAYPNSYAGTAINRSAFLASNPGKPPPAPMNGRSGRGLYYQHMVQPGNHGGIQVEDVHWNQTAAPGTEPSHVSGLPGAGAALLGLDDFSSIEHDPSSGGQLDPLLLSGDAVGAMGSFTHEQFNLLDWNNESQSFGQEPTFPSEDRRDPGAFSDDEFAEYLEGGPR